MKRRRRYGERYSGLPYPEEFKNRMRALFPNSNRIEDALEGGWDSLGRWFDELCSYPAVSVDDILDYVNHGNVSELIDYCDASLKRRRELKALSNEWQRIVYLDDQGCRPWDKEA